MRLSSKQRHLSSEIDVHSRWNAGEMKEDLWASASGSQRALVDRWPTFSVRTLKDKWTKLFEGKVQGVVGR